jgi:NDP-sugar pyrophosphorylase family protein
MSADVFILAAGLGTRLRPITASIPKPLVKIQGKSLLERHLERLDSLGFHRVMINLHYLPELIREFVGDGSKWGLEVAYSYEPELLDTGGGIKNIESWIRSDRMLVINSDSLFAEDPPLEELLKSPSEMSLLVGPERGFTKLFTDGQGRLVGFDLKSMEGAQVVNYLGVMALGRDYIATLPTGVFSITKDCIPPLLSANREVRTVSYTAFWSDVGTPERLLEAERYFGVEIR